MAAEPRKDNIDKNVKAPNIFERAKEEIGTVLHHRRHKESHGLREDIDENTSLDDVKAPNVFERAKEEIEALVQTIHTKKENGSHEKRSDSAKKETKLEKTEDGVKAPNLNEKAKEEVGSIIHKGKSPHHHHETHGTSDDIDDTTRIDEVKGPNIFERAKEEIEAIVDAIHPKKQSKKESSTFVPSPKEEGGFGASIARGLEKVCSPAKEGGFRSSVGRGLEKVCAPWGNKKA